MMWSVEYYCDIHGKEPVANFIDSLSMELQTKILRYIDLLARYGVLLKEPYTKQIRGKLRELRVSDKSGNVRVIYFTYTGRKFILLHAFMKKTMKTPKTDIDIAERRMKDFMERLGGI